MGSRNLNQVNSCPNPAHANCEPIELAEMLMKLAGSVVIEQHIGKLLEVVEAHQLGTRKAGRSRADSANCERAGLGHCVGPQGRHGR